MKFTRIIIQDEERATIYEGEDAQAFADWLGGAIQIAELHGMLPPKPDHTRVVQSPDEIEMLGMAIHKSRRAE